MAKRFKIALFTIFVAATLSVAVWRSSLLYPGLTDALREQLRNSAFLDIQMTEHSGDGIQSNFQVSEREEIEAFADAIEIVETLNGTCYCMVSAVITYPAQDDQLTSFVIISNVTLDWESELVADGRIPEAQVFLTESSMSNLTNWFARHGKKLDH